MKKSYDSLSLFYNDYLLAHQNRKCRQLHYIGTSLFLIMLITGCIFQQYYLLILMPVVGYGFAFAGHFIYEKNRPATFEHPFMSFASDFIMCWHALTGQLDKRLERARQQSAQASETGDISV